MAFIRFGGSLSEEDEKRLRRIKFKNSINQGVVKFLSVIGGFILLLLFVTILVYIDKLASKSMVLTNEEYNNFFLTLFQVQSTVATLSITIVSLITVIFKERIFGIYLSKYVLFIKSKFFSNAKLILLTIILIILNGVFTMINYYYASLVLFLLTIVLVLLLVKSTFWIFRDTSSLDDVIKNYFLKRIKVNSEKLNLCKSNEEMQSIEFILAQNPNLKAPHKELESLLSEWNNDTCIKLNDNRFNDYAPNIDIIYSIHYEFNMDKMCYLKSYTLDILSQYTHEIVNRLITHKQYELSFKTVELLSGFLYLKYTNYRIDKDVLMKVCGYFNYYYQLTQLIAEITSQYKFNKDYIYRLITVLFEYSKYLMISIDAYVDTDNYRYDDYKDAIIGIFKLYYVAIKEQKFYSKDDKTMCYSIFQAYINEYNNIGNDKDKCDKIGSHGHFWRSFLDYTHYLYCKKDFNKVRIIDMNHEDLVKTEIDKLRTDIYLSFMEFNKIF